MILEQKKKLERVRENIELSTEIIEDIKKYLYKSGTSKYLVEQLIIAVTTKAEFEFKEMDLIKSLDLLYHAKNYKND